MTIMEAPAQTLTLTRTIPAPAAAVYKMFTERDGVRDWLSEDVHLRAAVGGHLLCTWQGGAYAIGQFTALEENRKVAFQWKAHYESSESVVEVTLSEAGSNTTLTLTHSDLPAEADPDTTQKEWERRLETLQMTFQTGEDTRLSHRILIGIIPGQLTKENAAKLGVPVEQGVKVDGVLDNLGAKAAGIQANDVVVEVNGKTVTPEAPIGVALANNRPGDEVPVSFYRGAEKHAVTVKLAGYPIPPVPASMAALADRTEASYQKLDTDLSALFNGVSEAEAAHQPAPGEWSANQVIAHLILSELWVQHWMGSLVETEETSGWSGNGAARLAGVMAIYPTSADLLAELRRRWKETVALVRAIPAPASENKSNLWWFSFELHQQAEQHARTHFSQIREAIASARA